MEKFYFKALSRKGTRSYVSQGCLDHSPSISVPACSTISTQASYLVQDWFLKLWLWCLCISCMILLNKNTNEWSLWCTLGANWNPWWVNVILLTLPVQVWEVPTSDQPRFWHPRKAALGQDAGGHGETGGLAWPRDDKKEWEKGLSSGQVTETDNHQEFSGHPFNTEWAFLYNLISSLGWG